jgi:hypothetical protein
MRAPAKAGRASKNHYNFTQKPKKKLTKAHTRILFKELGRVSHCLRRVRRRKLMTKQESEKGGTKSGEGVKHNHRDDGAPPETSGVVKARKISADDRPPQVGSMVKARKTSADDSPPQVGSMVKARRSADDPSDKPRRSHSNEKVNPRISPRRKEDF